MRFANLLPVILHWNFSSYMPLQFLMDKLMQGASEKAVNQDRAQLEILKTLIGHSITSAEPRYTKGFAYKTVGRHIESKDCTD